MSSKKNIDRLFQEKFKEFDVKPDPKVWQNIESKLKKEEKEDRFVIIPFWLKLGGIAASLLLMFFLGDTLLNNPESTNMPSVVDTEKTNSNKSINKNEENSTTLDLKNANLNKTANQETESTTPTTVTGSDTSITNDDESGKASIVNTNKKNANLLNKVSNKLVVSTVVSGKDSTKNNSATTNNSNSNIALNTTFNTNEDVLVSSKNKSKQTTKNPLNTATKDAVVENKTENKTENKKVKNTVAINEVEKQNDATKEDNLKPSIKDAIAATKETEDNLEKEENSNSKWSVNTNIAPVYYDSFGEGSHIDSQFNKNAKSGEVNTSYGVKVGYALNDRITVRSGISRLNLSYDTNDVVVYEKLGDNSSLRNIDFLTSTSGQQLNMISAKSVNNIENSRTLIQDISQQMSYYEVPLEVEYKLLSKRFGINIVGGFSTFLLDDNQIMSQLNGVDTKIGQANNINSLSFSTNLGIGIDYKFSKAVVFNVEPTFKYHLNAFNNTSGSFNPYIIGLYTGISYRF